MDERPRHVVIDARKAFDGGIGRHLREIGRRLPGVLPGWRFTLLVTPGTGAELEAEGFRGEPFALLDETASKYGLAELWRLPRTVRSLGPDLYHSPHYVLPPRLPCPSIVTIHDLIHLKRPATPLHRWYAMLAMGSACRSARRILTVSRTSAQDIQTMLGVPADRVQVVPNGVAIPQTSRVPPTAVRYVLYIGSLKPHKNVPTLLAGFARLEIDERLELWLAGHWLREERWRRELERQAAAEGVEERVRFIGRFPDSALPGLMAGARVLVSPSWEEGFGLPALEALAHSTPVVASGRGAHREVLGDAARYVDGADPEGLARAIREVLLEGPEAAAERRRRGVSRADRYSWDDAAAATAHAYRLALGPG